MRVDDVLSTHTEGLAPLNRPILIVALTGWFDASATATGALEWLLRDRVAPVVATIDPDPFYDFTQERPEVWFDEGDETYFMTYSGCDKGCYQVGWAASSDGLRWVAAPEPVVPSGQADWSAQATREAYLAPHDGTLGFVFTGNDGDIERIGQGHAPLN